MTAVLIPIQPKSCELIANGKATIEWRKATPKLDTPFKAYIYCTKPRKIIHGYPAVELLLKHIDGGIECGFSFQIATERGVFAKDNFLSGKIIGEFVCDKIYEYFDVAPKCKKGYGWHISQLKIYDKPKALSQFIKPCPYAVSQCKVGAHICKYFNFKNTFGGFCDYVHRLTRPPRSYCYVEELQ